MAVGTTADVGIKQALHDLVTIYARAIDRGDAALLATVFHADADVVTGFVDGKAPDYAREICEIVRTSQQSTFHSMTNHYFEIYGDVAAGETYLLAHIVTAADTPEQLLIGGRYLDRFEKRNDVWKIAHRLYVQDWSMSTPAQAGNDTPSPVIRGSYSPGDPAEAFWADVRG